jgi:hypothetical protein
MPSAKVKVIRADITRTRKTITVHEGCFLKMCAESKTLASALDSVGSEIVG